MRKDAKIYLAHIRDAIVAIREYTVDGEQAFMQDRKTQDAVIRNLEIIGEAVKNLPKQTTAEYNNIPWKSISGMRDRLIHQYFGVNLQLVWGVVEHRLEELLDAVEVELDR
jgi:uncharacterized protein with HEPN domain